MTTPGVLVMIVLPLEAWTLRVAQRRLFWDIARVVRWRWLAYAIALPSTVAHELAHVTMAIALGVPIGRRAGGAIELFRPRYDPRTRTLRLGAVAIGTTGVLRRSLIGVAPFLLVPCLLVGINVLLLGTANPLSLLGTGAPVQHLALWRIAIWVACAILLPMAAFPSSGDRIGVGGAAALAIVAGLAASIVVVIGGAQELIRLIDGIVSILLLPALAAGMLLLLFSRPRQRSGRRGSRAVARAR